MNNKLTTILKYSIINDFKLNKTKGKQISSEDTIKKKYKLYLFIAVVIVFYVWIYFNMFYDAYKPNGLEAYVLPMFMLLTTFFSFIYAIRLTESVLFKAKDYELLVSLPIKRNIILSSKIIYILLINYFISFLVMVPASIFMVNKEGLSGIYVFVSFILSIFIPIIPIILGSLISILIGFISSKIKFTNIITTAITMLFVIACMFMPNMFSEEAVVGLTPEIFDNLLRTYYYPALVFKNAITNMDILNILAYIVINIGIFGIFVFAVSKLYSNINQKMKEQYKVGKFVEKKYKQNAPIVTMTKKELKKLFTTPIYFMNTCFSVVMIVLAAIAALFMDDASLSEILGGVNSMGGIGTILVLAISVMAGFACTTGSSISLEGKNIWIYKTMPVKTKDIFNSKILTNMIAVIPCVILSVILFAIRFNISRIEFMLAIILPVIFNIFTSIFGVLINMKYPMLDFETEVQVVKRSTASMLSIFIPFAILLAGLVICMSMSNIYLAFIVFAGIMAVSSYLIYMLLMKWGTKRFQTIYDK